jgi:hypothetical protein
MVSAMLGQRAGQGADWRPVAGFHLALPIAVLARLDGAGVQAVAVPRDGVTHAELDLAAAGEPPAATAYTAPSSSAPRSPTQCAPGWDVTLPFDPFGEIGL